jgi:NAD(P)-dependent dehydrogenase (short-subunit alcohol dehydrogenase family)
MTLEGKVALVTGGGRGIGAACARELAANGVRTAVVARTRAQIDSVAADIERAGGAAAAFTADVTDAASVREAVRAATARFGTIDILVNNAGTATSAPLAKTTLEDWNRMFAVNATSAFLCTKEVLPDMVARGWGRIVNVASVAARTGGRYIAAYAASKHALLGLTRCVAAEVAAHGVTVNAVCPGYVDTDMTQESLRRITERTGKSRDDALAHILSHSPQGRLVEPEEVASVVCALCVDGARSINGEAIVIDGGELLS